MLAALLQLSSSDDPAENLAATRALMREVAKGGAGFLLTPEVTNCVSSSRARQMQVLRHEQDDPTLAGLRDEAAALGVWLLIGSLGLKTEDADGRFANRSFLIAPDGGIVARYDKIHMFDVQIGPNEAIRESDGYRPGTAATLAKTPFAQLGMTICYDMRFPYLYRALAQAGAQVITVPSAFHPVTGAAHWQVLLRARAIETGCYILAPAQTGQHRLQDGKPRQSYGHSLAVSPWGEVVASLDDAPGLAFVDLDLSQVESARRRIPSLTHDCSFEGP